jgi:hypothetical protein
MQGQIESNDECGMMNTNGNPLTRGSFIIHFSAFAHQALFTQPGSASTRFIHAWTAE